MRLKELKCKNCGATVKVAENVSQVECEFCHTTFAVEDAYYDGYKFEKGRMKAHSEQIEKGLEHVKGIIEPVGKVFAAQYIISTIIGVVIFAVVVGIIIFSVINQTNSVDEFDIERFNNIYEMYIGTEYGSSVERLIDEIITNNKKDKNHQITIKYKKTTIKDPEKMKQIKKEIDVWTKYEVTYEYDDDGFICLATIEELN